MLRFRSLARSLVVGDNPCRCCEPKGNVGRCGGFGRVRVRRKSAAIRSSRPIALKARGSSAECKRLQTICTVYGDIAFWLRDSPPPLYRFVPVVKVAAPPLISTVDYRNEARGTALRKSRSAPLSLRLLDGWKLLARPSIVVCTFDNLTATSNLCPWNRSEIIQWRNCARSFR